MNHTDNQGYIHVKGARENNLKDVSLSIPKHKITVFTGVSGSGKSSLVFDTIAAESQRQLNETYPSFIRHRLPHLGQPDTDLIENLSVAIVIDQKQIGNNARSTVGTATDIYTFLRLLYSRIGVPFVGYSQVFSFNDPAGMCEHCQGLGAEKKLNVDALIDRSKSLNEGAINFPTFQPGGYRWKRYAYSGFFDNDKKLADYSEDEWETLLNADDIKVTHPLPGWPPSHRYRGILVRFAEDFFSKNSRELKTHAAALARVVTAQVCPICHGARLNKKVLSSKINGKNIAECAAMQVSDLIEFLAKIQAPKATTIVQEMSERLRSVAEIGLGYLSLDRTTPTLSGGESQRIKMVKYLGSSLSDMLYIFDEPSTGLHPSNVGQLNDLLKRLRDKGNTVLVVEHDPDVIKTADHIVDMGPGAGLHGGKVVFQGSLSGLKHSNTLTGQFLSQAHPPKKNVRQPTGSLAITKTSLNNLKDVSVDIPTGILTAVTGVAGSGKSSLIYGVLAKQYPEATVINQRAIHASKRSSPASFIGILDPIRQLFAKANNVDVSLFSYNSKGACPVCKGLGTVTTDLAFMDPIVTICELCKGRRFTDSTLRLKLHDKSIYDVLKMSVEEAIKFFKEPSLKDALTAVSRVGLEYLELGQPLNTLSGGERQRIKLALELQNKNTIYILDEPTTGLHMSDVSRLIGIMNDLVDNGGTVIVIEHNVDVIAQADWIIDMGPGAGSEGGEVVFQGLPRDIQHSAHSITGKYI